MKPSDRKLLLAILRFVPHLVFVVFVQALGCVLLIFVMGVLFPEHPRVWDLPMLPYLCWSTWRVGSQIKRWSEAAVKTMC